MGIRSFPKRFLHFLYGIVQFLDMHLTDVIYDFMIDLFIMVRNEITEFSNLFPLKATDNHNFLLFSFFGVWIINSVSSLFRLTITWFPNWRKTISQLSNLKVRNIFKNKNCPSKIIEVLRRCQKMLKK